MLDRVETIFDDMNKYLKRLKRPVYQKNMEVFQRDNESFFSEMKAYVEHAEDKKEACIRIGEQFSEAVYGAFAKSGKLRPLLQGDLNFFMVYYVFPSILLIDSEYADMIAEELCTAWNKRNTAGEVGYMPYEKVCSTFQEKIFGIF